MDEHRKHVNSIKQTSASLISIETRESLILIAEFTMNGWRCNGILYESLSSLLNDLSPEYRASFSNELSEKLNRIIQF